MRKVVFILLILGLDVYAFDESDLAEKNQNFKEAYSLIKTKDYIRASKLLERDIRDFSDAPNIDYDYGWLVVCYAYSRQYSDLVRVYSVIRERFPGEVRDPVTNLGRNWDGKLEEAKAVVRASSDARALEAYKQLTAIDLATQNRMLDDISDTVKRAQQGEAKATKLLRENASQIIEAIIQKKLLLKAEQDAAANP